MILKNKELFAYTNEFERAHSRHQRDESETQENLPTGLIDKDMEWTETHEIIEYCRSAWRSESLVFLHCANQIPVVTARVQRELLCALQAADNRLSTMPRTSSEVLPC